MQRATVYSIYMNNIPREVVDAQRAVLDRFLPTGWEFKQWRADSYSHAAAMELCLTDNPSPLTVFLDIDCVPLNGHALELLAVRAELGMLVGAVQRANHVNNGCHLYVGPFCMALDKRRYVEVGEPTFYESARGDTGEELTYSWQAASKPVYFLWPNEVRQPLWDLTSGVKFGLGTTYDNLFYHEFCARASTGNFTAKCEQILSQKAVVA